MFSPRLFLLFCVILAVLSVVSAFSSTFLKSTSRGALQRSSISSSHYTKLAPNRCQKTCNCPSCARARVMNLGMSSETEGAAPKISKMDEAANLATVSITLSAEQTQKAFDAACEMFNEEVKTRGYKVPGFRPGAKLPVSYLYQMFGEDNVKGLCASLLGEDIQSECDKTGLALVGRGRILDFQTVDFSAGKPHNVDVEVDLWPQIGYGDGDGYKGFAVTVDRPPMDEDKYEKVKKSIQERYKKLGDTPVGYAAQMGDVVTVNMRGYELNGDGSKGDMLPNLASGDNVEIHLESGKFMEGMAEGLVGALNGDTKEIQVTFPIRPSGPGAALSGKKTIFEVDIKNVQTRVLPEWNDELAGIVRDNFSLAELEAEVRNAIDGEQDNSLDNLRNEALAKVLLERMTVNKLPESLIEETVKERFQEMLMDFKEQGSTEEQLQEMATPEKYSKYKEISLVNAEKIVKLGLAFRDIAEKEGIEVTEEECREQYTMICMQSKQKGEAPPEERQALTQIENNLLRKKVFDFIADQAAITWNVVAAEQLVA